MKKSLQKVVNSLRRRHPSFEECMTVLSAHMAEFSPPPSMKSALKENWMVFDTQTDKACIISSQGGVKLINPDPRTKFSGVCEKEST